MINFIRTHLAWKMLLSFLLVVLIGILVLITAASLFVPATFERHMDEMNAIMENGSSLSTNEEMQAELFSQYTIAVYEAIGYASVASLIAAVVASILISRQVVTPTLRMTGISQRIAEV